MEALTREVRILASSVSEFAMLGLRINQQDIEIPQIESGISPATVAAVCSSGASVKVQGTAQNPTGKLLV